MILLYFILHIILIINAANSLRRPTRRRLGIFEIVPSVKEQSFLTLFSLLLFIRPFLYFNYFFVNLVGDLLQIL